MDFFAGSGLVSVGLDSWFRTIWANDIDTSKKEIFDHNIENISLLKKDIVAIEPFEVPSADLYWASFPCQDLSLAGNYKGLSGARSSLVHEFLRIVEGQSPSDRAPLLALENVYGLITSNNGDDYCMIQNALERLGYNVGCVVLDASYWVPQSRVRVFIVCVKKGVDVSDFLSPRPLWCHPLALVKLSKRLPDFRFWKLTEPTSSIKRLKDVIIRNSEYDVFKSAQLMQLIPSHHVVKLHQHFAEDPSRVFAGYKRTRKGVQALELRFDEIGGCLRTAAGGSSKQLLIYVLNGNIVVRYMLPREAARLMGADDSFWLPENKNGAYTAMGDAVAVPVTSFLAEHLLSPVMAKVKRGSKLAV